MKDRRRQDTLSAVKRQRFLTWNRFSCFTLLFSLVSFFAFSPLRLFGVNFQPVLISKWPNPAMNSVLGDGIFFQQENGGDFGFNPAKEIQDMVIFPDQILILIKKSPNIPIFSKQNLQCIYQSPESSEHQLRLPVISIEDKDSNHQIVRCPVQPRHFNVSLAGKLPGNPHKRRYFKPLQQAYHWESLVYEALIDGNTTLIFVKGLNLRSEKLSDPFQFTCVFGWNFEKNPLFISSKALSVAQEIVRCSTPLSLKKNSKKLQELKVSIKPKNRRILPSLARPESGDVAGKKEHTMCICTMIRNQARFLKEWIMYHASLGVERWFVYDNNSEDSIHQVIESLHNHNITRHVWPWIKTQEAGFSHCALRARPACQWVGFIDIDEFLYLPGSLSLDDILRNYYDSPTIGELRISCHNFGPSGLSHVPEQGVTMGYTCRMATPERHKSILKPEALHTSLINVVHHFHLRDGFNYVNMGRGVMVINHYKYQVWEVFKTKFYRRVATYVADWQDKEKVGSKDRAPGLGTEAIEPPDWSSRFCEVTDTRLRDWVVEVFMDRKTHSLPWQEKSAQ